MTPHRSDSLIPERAFKRMMFKEMKMDMNKPLIINSNRTHKKLSEIRLAMQDMKTKFNKKK